MSNEQIIWNFLIKEFSAAGAAGLMGNLFAESGLKPNNMQDTFQLRLAFTDETYTKAVDEGQYKNFVRDSVGYGIAQWTYYSRKQNLLNYAKEKKVSVGNLWMQLEFLVKELKEQYNSLYLFLCTTSSVQEASNKVLLEFEQPQYTGENIKKLRYQYSLNYYNKYSAKGGGSMLTIKKESRQQLSKNFISIEFDCKGVGCCSQTLIDEKLVEYLQKIRDHFNKPITITSAYRCATHNSRVGGATGSYHTKGQAADFVVEGVTSAEVARYAESIGIKGFGLYETTKDGFFVHIDTRTYKSFWYGKSELPRTTFGGSNSQDKNGSYHKSQTKYNIKLYYAQLGDQGEDIRILQEILKVHGYNIQASGKYDEATRQVVIDFQRKNKIGADGIVGVQTMQKLLGY